VKIVNQIGERQMLNIRRAILLYEKDDARSGISDVRKAMVVATIHDVVVDGKGVARIKPGACPTVEAMRDLGRSLQVWEGNGYLPPEVICVQTRRVVWHCAAQRRPIFFDCDNAALRRLSGKQVAHPHLLFDADGRGLRVFALSNDGRPGPDARLFHAPYFNVYEDGRMCGGSARVPSDYSVKSIRAWEAAFFDSAFTHANVHGPKTLTTHAGGHDGLWNAMAKRSRFDDRYLVRRRQRLNELLSHND
jgi:PRTRC genetic system protein B